MRAAEIATLFYWTPKNIFDQQKGVSFQKSKKVLKHSILMYTVQYVSFSYNQQQNRLWIAVQI